MTRRWIGVGWLAVAVAAGAMGCGGRAAHCIYELKGSEVCEQDNMAASWCRSVRKGAAESADDSLDPNCKGLGFPVNCGDQCVPNDDTESCGTFFFAESEQACDAAFPPS